MITLEEITGGETKNIEFKESLPPKSLHYLKTVVAFANTLGGKIIIGVEDRTHKIVGVPNETIFKTMDSITNAISDACTPAILPDVAIQTVEGKNLIVIDVPMGRNRPYYIKSLGMVDGTFIRVSGTSRQPGEARLKDLMFEGAGRSYDQTVWFDHHVTKKDIDDLCAHMKTVALHNCYNEEMKQHVRDVTIAQLLSWHILEEREGELLPTNAWRMLAGDDDMFLQIQCAVFKGNDRILFLDKREYGGPIDDQIEQAYQFVLRNIRLGAQIRGIYRQDIFEIPPIAIRELIINAVTHRNYLEPSCIQVALYDNRLEITSPGSLPMGMTIEKMKAGRTCIRNHALARALSYMNLIENWGSGIRKITDACRDAGLREPEFLDMESSVRVNIYRKDGELKANEDGQRIEETAQKTDNVVESTPQVTKDTPQVTKDTPQVTKDTPQVTENTPQVRMQSLHGKSSFQDERIIAFLKCFQDVPLKASELRQRMNLSDRKSFNDKYIKPCLERKWIEMTIPDKPNSQNQAYRITQRGRDVMEGSLEEDGEFGG